MLHAPTVGTNQKNGPVSRTRRPESTGMPVATQLQPVVRPSQAGRLLQRQCACGGTPGPTGECAACRARREAVMTRRAANRGEASAVPSIVHDVLRSPGQPLDMPTRAFMEPRFGADFGGVRIHTDARAAESARAVRALAYTVGNHLVFGEGRYQPGSQGGKRLLAHELVHAIQQTQSRATSPPLPPRLRMGDAGDVYEREAEAQARRALDGNPGGLLQVQPRFRVPELQRFASCGSPEECPPRVSGEVERARRSPMFVGGVSGPVVGLLVGNFAVGSSALKPDLQRNSAWMNYLDQMAANTNVRWEILGFTDCAGDESTNERLRLARATVVYNALPQRARNRVDGFSAASLSDCVAENADEQGRAYNRSALISQASVEYAFEEETVTVSPYAACYDGTTVFVSKNGRSHSCPAVTGNIGAPTDDGVYCIRRQGEAQRSPLFGADRSRWYLLEPLFTTTRSRMHLHPGRFSEGCITVTDSSCFDQLADVLNGPGTVAGTGYDGYPPGNREGVINPPQSVTCVGRMLVRRRTGGCGFMSRPPAP
jgi:outer membrane protein OmpA-like peptidoglycan-associated protein